MKTPNVHILERYFYSGWAFFVPYLIVYFVGAALNAKTPVLLMGFKGLHLVNLFLIATAVVDVGRSRKIPWNWHSLWWPSLFFVFLATGAYLEYPADPWEHLRRTYEWSLTPSVQSHSNWHKMAYSFNYSLVSLFPFEYRRATIDALSAGWQVLWLFQFSRFARRLFGPRPGTRFVTLAYLLFFGTSIFSMRYYALSSTPLAQISLYASLGILFSLKRQPGEWLKLGCLVGLILGNHLQELILLGIGTVAIVSHRALTAQRRSRWLPATVMAFGVVVAICSPFAPSNAYVWHGIYRLWDTGLPFFHTVGLVGWATAGLCVLLVGFKRPFPLIAWMYLVPLLLAIFPPFVSLLSSVTDGPNLYRTLYLLPSGVVLAAAVSGVKSWRWRALGMIAIVLCSLPARSPWFGRAWFQFHRVDPQLELRHLDPLAEYFRSIRFFEGPARLYTDGLTKSFLNSWLGLPLDRNRIHPYSETLLFGDYQSSFTKLDADLLGSLLVIHPAKVPPPPDSWVARRGRHWYPHTVEFTSRYSAGSFLLAHNLQAGMWKCQPLEPFYFFLMRPSEIDRLGLHFPDTQCPIPLRD